MASLAGPSSSLGEDEDLLRIVVDALPFLVSYITADERYGMVNAAYERWFGVAAEDLLGKKLVEVVGERAYAVLRPYVLRGLAGERFDFEQHGVGYRFGGTRDIKVRFIPHVAKGGNVSGYIAMVEDITVKRQTERALGLSQARLHVALRAGGMGTWDLDLSTGVLTCSDTCKANYGRGPQDSFTYQELAASVLEEDRPSWRETVQQAIEKCADLDIEYRTRWPDGTVHWVNVRASCMPGLEGNARALSGISAMIDERKAVEEELRVVDRRKDEFLSTASHELRTPLNAILGWATLLQRGDLDDSARQKAAVTIERNARSQVKLIEDILDGSRMLSGNLRLEVEPLDFAEVVRAATDVVRPAATAKSIRLSLELDARVPQITGDAARLQQVVWNLVMNAIKFTQKGGAIDVALAPLESSVQLRVADTGQGIDAALLPHIFERLRQADSSTTRRFGGLGLGLTLVKHLVDAHGGEVRAESEGEGRGALFVVTLPIRAVVTELRAANPSRSRSSFPPVVPEKRLEGVTALIVDDEADACELIATVLVKSGASVRTASSAEAAIEAVERERPAIIVSDIGMPVTDGYSFMRRLRGEPVSDTARVPAIALTAYAREEDRALALAAGFQEHLTKPVEPSLLLETIARLLGRESP